MIHTRYFQGNRSVLFSMLVGVGMVFLCVDSVFAVIRLQSYSPKNHRRFYVGADKDFIGADFDSSGIGRGTTANRWATMISDNYFISARHWHPTFGDKVRFYHTNDPNGTFEEHTVASGIRLEGELWLAKFEETPSANVARYPVVDLGAQANYDDVEIFSYGLDSGISSLSHALGRNTIDSNTIHSQTVGGTTGLAYTFDFDNSGGLGADESQIQPGDSGAPSFVAFGDQLALVGIHWYIQGNASGDAFVSGYLDELDHFLDIRGDSLNVIVPEPSSAALLLAACSLAVTVRRRSRRIAS